MNALARTLSALLITPVLALPVFGQSAQQLTLTEVLQVAMQRAELSGRDLPDSAVYRSSSWLAALPSVTVSYLESDEKDGVDEAEISLNLPIKSGGRRKADRALRGLSAEMEQFNGLQRALYFSGLIRESLWSHRIAEARSRFAAEKRQLLLAMEQRQRDLLAVNATSSYAVLLLQKELLDVEISQQEYQQEARQWQQRYRQVTGLGSLPAVIDEALFTGAQQQLGQHPQLLALRSAYEQQRQLLLADSDKAADWNVSLHAKNLSAGAYDEDQYGLAVEMPLSFLDMQSQSSSSELISVTRQYNLAREALTAQLYDRWQVLAGETRALQEKQTLLHRSSEISQQIAKQLADLLASNEISQDVALRRNLDAIDSRATLHINQLTINQNNAMLRQAAGLSL